MTGYALPIKRLIAELGKLPGIGEKTATRLATFILRASGEDARRLAECIVEVKQKIRLCSICFNLAEGDVCEICMDPSRDKGIICVVEEPDSLIAIEESGSFRGTYHVLHGALSPLDGIGPDHLRIQDFLKRVENNRVEEIIIATNPSVQGESTALLISKVVKGLNINVTRIALGVPVGGDLKYMDKMTLSKSMEYRRGI
ncbi:MAG: recombination mediator RecR [Syntrophaceae bacterium]